MNRYWTGFVTALVLSSVVVLGGWSSKELLSGTYKTMQQISDTTTVFFPKTYGDNAGPREVHSPDSSVSVKYASLVRKTGSGLGKFLFYSRSYPAGAETVYVGDTPYQFSGDAKALSKVKPLDVAASTFQIEGMN